MVNLPAEVTADILSRLPAKTLLRFRCVSVSWCALIDDPDFIKMYLKRSIESNTNLSLILRDCYLYSVDFDSLDNVVELDHPLKCEEFGTEVLGSCNGLLCLYNREEDIVLWNPCTRQFKKLPLTPIEFPRDFCICQYMIYGFGHDAVTDDYKVVRIVQFYGDDDDSFDSEVKVYSLKTNSWRRIKDNLYYLRYKRAYGVLAGGALHWVASRKPESDTSNLILAFDLGVEEYQEVPQPDYADKNFHMNVDVLGGCLCILCNYYKVRVDVWVMKEYGVKESWTKLFSIAQPKVIRAFEYVRPLAYSNSGGEVLLEQDNKRLLWYDLEEKKVKNVRICGLPDSLEAGICVGSLVPLNNDSEKRKKNKNRKKRDDFLPKGDKQSGEISNEVAMPKLPAEVIANILSRLPIKTLLCFRCVSKPWCALINDPDFIKMHLKRSTASNTNISLILRDCYLYSVDFDLLDNAIELDHPLKSPRYGTEVLGSCNGLLCLYNGEEDIVIWNPSTRKCWKLPVTPIQFPSYFTCCEYIIYGFGYDPASDDYKVVRIVQFYGKDHDSFDSEVKVYSLKANLWRRIKDNPYYLRYKRAWGVFASGALHWVVTRKPESETSNLIVAFDLGVEEYREVPQPNFSDNDFQMNVGILGGCLCILCNYFKVRMDIWVMEYGVESWTKLCSIRQPKVNRSFEYLRPLAYSKSGGKVLLEQDNDKLFWYDLKKKRIKNVRISGMPNSFDAEICVGSLVPLTGVRGIDVKKHEGQDKRKEKKSRKKRDDFLSEGFKLVL